MAFTNLPGVFHEKQDGGTQVINASAGPRVLVLGTSTAGVSDTPYNVTQTKLALGEFGSVGTLLRGMYEVKGAGALNVTLMRIGASAAILTGVGKNAGDGLTITTSAKDNDASIQYSFYWNATAKRLVIYDVESDGVIFDRDYNETIADVDLGLIYVTGTVETGSVSIGSASNLRTLRQASVDHAGILTLTEGTDGVFQTTTSPAQAGLSRMEMYEALFKGYALLENETFDFVVPMDVYLDDTNVADGDAFTAPGSGAYPNINDPANDALLYFYAEEYQGEWYFWWRESKTTGVPEIYVHGNAGQSNPTYMTPAGVDLRTTTFNTVSFGYQLANFCYTISRDSNECHGVIGVKPPDSLGLKDVSNWIGVAPTYTTQEDGDIIINAALDNGTGLLGNKFMGGQYAFRSGVGYGGFIATDTGYEDGTELLDDGDEEIDIGQYISVCGSWITVFNNADTTGNGYITTLAPTYAGMIVEMDAKSAPTNKEIPGVRLPYNVNNAKLDALAGARYVVARRTGRGIVIADAPTAAHPTSDYRRLTTVRIVKAVVDNVRNVIDPFIGEAGTNLQRAALQTACEQELQRLQKAGYLTRYEVAVTQTAAERVNGDATIELVLVPAWELRQVTLKISLLPT